MANLQPIRTIVDADHALETGVYHPLLIYKHNPSCTVSIQASREVEAFLHAKPPAGLRSFIVDVRESKATSHHIEQETGVHHESPQVIILKHKKPVARASHQGITRHWIQHACAEHF